MDSRRKGKDFELRVAKKIGKALNTEPKRSSYHGKYWDDNGVDLMPDETAPFLVQCKDVESGKFLHDTLAGMYQDKTKINVVVHKLNRRPPVVVLSFDDFCELVEICKNNGIF